MGKQAPALADVLGPRQAPWSSRTLMPGAVTVFYPDRAPAAPVTAEAQLPVAPGSGDGNVTVPCLVHARVLLQPCSTCASLPPKCLTLLRDTSCSPARRFAAGTCPNPCS